MIFDFLIFLQMYPSRWIKFRVLDKIDMFGWGLLKEHLCKTFVKISAMR